MSTRLRLGAVVIASALVIAAIVVGVIVLTRPTDGGQARAGAEPTASPSPSRTPAVRFHVYLEPYPPGTGWQQPYGVVESSLQARIKSLILGALPADKTAEAKLYESTGVGTESQMLLAAAGDHNNVNGGQLHAPELTKVMDNVAPTTGLVTNPVQLHPAARGLNFGCATATWGKVAGTICEWHDGWTLGFAFFDGKKPQDVEGSFGSLIHAAVTSYIPAKG